MVMLACQHCGFACGNAGALRNHEASCKQASVTPGRGRYTGAVSSNSRDVRPSSVGTTEDEANAERRWACKYCGHICGNHGGLANHEKFCRGDPRTQHEVSRARATLPGGARPSSSSRSAAEAALEQGSIEGMQLIRDRNEPSGFAGVYGYGMAKAERYRAVLTTRCDARGKKRHRVLGSFATAEEASLCIARAERQHMRDR